MLCYLFALLGFRLKIVEPTWEEFYGLEEESRPFEEYFRYGEYVDDIFFTPVSKGRGQGGAAGGPASLLLGFGFGCTAFLYGSVLGKGTRAGGGGTCNRRGSVFVTWLGVWLHIFLLRETTAQPSGLWLHIFCMALCGGLSC